MEYQDICKTSLNETHLPTLCLNMIVRNESKIICRLLNSVLPIIDTYCICDTGSTDNTCEIIKNFFDEKKIKGKIVNFPFKNFEHNRNFALQSAYGMSEYLLLLDADMELTLNGFDKNILRTADVFCVFQGNFTFFYQNVRILKNKPGFSYIGVTHEYLNVPNGNNKVTLKKDTIFINDIGDGGWKENKYKRDIELLSNFLAEHPNHDRTLFYLANSYFNLGNFIDAIENYKKRTEVGGWIEEIFYSYYKIGICYEKLGDMSNAIYYWLEAYNHHNTRLESIYKIVEYYRIAGKQKICNNFINMVKNTLLKHQTGELTTDNFLFVDNEPYKYLFDYEFSIIAYYLNIKNINNEVVNIFNNCYNNNNLNNVLTNMKFYKFILKPKIIYNLNDFFTQKINDKNYDFRSSSSSIIQNGSNGYFMNIRFVNYELINEYRTYKYDNYILSLNKYVELDRNFNVISTKLFDEIFHDGRKYGGVEDVRIFYDKKQDKITYIGVGLHKNENIGIMYGDYDISKNYLHTNELKSEFNNNNCEKNWVYFYHKNEIHIVYSWGPLKICSINKETNKIIEVKNVKMPMLFNHVRGSSCGYNFNNCEIWFIVHLVSYETPRHYYHLICVFDNDMNLLRYSAPFKFSDFCIEYSLSIIVEKKRVIITHSEADSTTNICIYEKEYIDNILIYK